MAAFRSHALLSVCFTCFLITADADVFSVATFPDGRYEIQINTVTWLNSAPTFFVINDTRFSADDGSLVLDSINTTSSGSGQFGAEFSTNFHYRAGDVPIITSIVIYGTQIMSFIVRFPDGASNTNHSYMDGVICGFPGFKLHNTSNLGYVSFGGADVQELSVGRWGPSASIQDSLEGSSPFSVFDTNGNALTFGQLNNVMTTPLWQDKTNNFLYYGIMGGIEQIPTNFSYHIFSAYSSEGPENSMSVWGFVIRSLVYKGAKPEDPSGDAIGYWTDEGSYYFDKTDGTSTYEDTLIKVFSDAHNRSIPYRYVELDTWWFTKGQGGGVKEWTAPTDIFPKGIEYVHRSLNVPIVAKNNFWSSDNVYAKQNGGAFNFEVEGDMAIPTDEAFWDKIFSESKQWGLVTYIQDNMTEIFRNFPRMQTDLNFARDWLVKMAASALRHNITIQYSGATPTMALLALQLPAVTQLRVLGGHGTESDQRNILASSVFSALSYVFAFKGALLTQDQKGGVSGTTSAAQSSVIAVLSGGLVGIGDKIGHTNTSIIKRMCSSDGTILKPNRPAQQLNAQVVQMTFQDGSGPDADIWATLTGVYKGGASPDQVYGIIYVSGLNRTFDITPTSAGIGFEYPVSKIFSAANPTKHYDFSDSKPFSIPPCQLDFCMYYTSPVINYKNREVFVLGELDKWVPMSRNRIVNVTVGDVITVYVKGQAGESVEMWFADDVRFGALKTIIGADGQGSVIYEIKSHPVNKSHLKRVSTVAVVMCILATVMFMM
ncbi:uncharacterized protein [Haliotis asinina]|uniref:uncharacterized protein n=1 Tax=Haliotis asinina TaxID=109174 RepID=UPI0035324F00